MPPAPPITAGYAIYGMFEIAGTNNLYYNSVYVGGTGVASASTTFGFVSNVTARHAQLRRQHFLERAQ